MDKQALRNKLIAENIPHDTYSLNGGLPYDKYCLSQNNGLWEVYYSERGGKFKLKTFTSEKNACEYFYKWLIDRLKFDGII